jgi:uncharacterized protein (DUF1501 family)
VLVWLRGGADGLSLIAPYRDPAYYKARPRVALTPPCSAANAAIPLTDSLAMHPGFAPLRSWFDAGDAAWVPGVGSAKLLRSHSAAENAMRASLAAKLGGAAYESFPGSVQEQFAALLRRVQGGTAPSVTLIEARGWDTHAGQGSGTQGLLGAQVRDLATALCALRAGLGQTLRGVSLLVFSEFGRTVRESLMFGTDDSYASAALLVGGQRFEAPALGAWPSLQEDALLEGRHIRPTLSFDALLGNWWRQRS